MILLLAAMGCGSGDAVDSAVPELAPEVFYGQPGVFGAGYEETEVTYLEEDGSERTLRLAVWFPSDSTEGTPVKYRGLFEAPGAIGDVEPTSGTHPVVVFSHGHQGYAEASSRQMVHLASHGWVVLAPDHTGNTTFDSPDRETSIYWRRPRDVSAVIDWAEQGGLGLDVDTDSVVAMGHSVGGYTVLALSGAVYDIEGLEQLCASGSTDPICTDWGPEQVTRFGAGFRDSRVISAVVLAAGDASRFGAGLSAIEVPMLQGTGGLDSGADNEPIWEGLTRSDARRLHMLTAGHNTFSDYSGVLDSHPDLMDPSEGWDVLNIALAAWSDWALGQLRGEAIVNGEVDLHPDVQWRLPEL